MNTVNIYFIDNNTIEMHNIKNEDILQFLEWYYSDKGEHYSFISPKKDNFVTFKKEKITRIELNASDENETLEKLFENVKWRNKNESV